MKSSKSLFSVRFVMVILACSLFPSFTLLSQENPLSNSMIKGKVLYKGRCAGCHKPDGSGFLRNRLTPPLAQSDYLLKNKENGIRVLLFGLKGKVIVNGLEYDEEMPPIAWSDQEISDVLNYVRNSWGNKGTYISKEEVAKIKKEGKPNRK